MIESLACRIFILANFALSLAIELLDGEVITLRHLVNVDQKLNSCALTDICFEDKLTDLELTIKGTSLGQFMVMDDDECFDMCPRRANTCDPKINTRWCDGSEFEDFFILEDELICMKLWKENIKRCMQASLTDKFVRMEPYVPGMSMNMRILKKKSCDARCSTCSFDGICSKCILPILQIINNFCSCKAEEIEDTIDGTFQCLPCREPCQTCQFKQTQCTSCISGRQYEYYPPENKCVCPIGLYENKEEFICQNCEPSCKTCLQSGINSCLSCHSTAQLYLRNCVCRLGTYASYSTGTLQCDLCDEKCNSCIQSGACTSCFVEKYYVLDQSENLCRCQKGYYDQGIECLVCHPSCQTCIGPTSNDCLKCHSPSILVNSECQCDMNESFQPRMCKCLGATLWVKQYCLDCHYTCLTCTEIGTCTSCNSGLRELKASLCGCIKGFYDNGHDVECQPCDVSCISCNGKGSQACTECSQQSQLINGACQCNQGFQLASQPGICIQICPAETFLLDIGQDKSCQPCHESCLTCSGYSYRSCYTCRQEVNYVNFENSNKEVYYVTDTIIFKGNVQNFVCENGISTKTQPYKTIQVFWKFIDEKQNILLQETQDYTGFTSQFTLPQRIGSPGLNYIVEFSTSYAKATQSISFARQSPIGVFSNGNQTICYIEPVNITLNIYYPDLSLKPLEDLSQVGFLWSCQTQVDGTACQSSMNQQIVFNQTTNVQYIPGNTFGINTVVLFRVIFKTDGNLESVSTMYLTILDVGTKPVKLQYSALLIDRTINLSDRQLISISNVEGFDNVLYQASYIYDQQVVSLEYFYYNSYPLTLPTIDYVDQTILLCVITISNKQTHFITKAVINIKINFPPVNCKIDKLTNGTDLNHYYDFLIYDCQDFNPPLEYALQIYKSKEDYHSDALEQEQYRALTLRGFSGQAFMSVILSPAKETEVIIVVLIKDSLGAQTKIRGTVSIDPSPLQDSKAILKDIYDVQSAQERLLLIMAYCVRLSSLSIDPEITRLREALIKQLSDLNGPLSPHESILQSKNLLYSKGDVLPTVIDIEADLLIQEASNYLDEILSTKKEIVFSVYQFGITPDFETKLKQQHPFLLVIAQTLGLLLTRNLVNLELSSENISKQNEIILNLISDISSIQLYGTQPNEAIYQVHNEEYSQTSAFLTQEGINRLTSAHLTPITNENIADNINITNATKQMFYSLRVSQFEHNPKASDISFPYPDQRNPLVSYEIKPQFENQFNESQAFKSSNIQLNENITIKIKMTTKTKNKTKSKNTTQTEQIKCLSQANSNWSNTHCLTTPKNDTVRCECDELTLVTVVDDAMGLFDTRKEIFTEKTPYRINEYRWYMSYLLYVQIAITILCILLAIRGYQLDKIDRIPDPTPKTPMEIVTPMTEINYIKTEIEGESTTIVKQEPSLDISFKKFLLVISMSIIQNNHKISAILTIYHPTLSRPLRVVLLYSGMLTTLAISLYFGINLSIIRVALVGIITSVVTTIQQTIFEKTLSTTLRSGQIFSRMLLGSIQGLYLYIILAVVSSANSMEEINICLIQYVLSILLDNLLIQAVRLYFDYQYERLKKIHSQQKSKEQENEKQENQALS